VDARSPDGSVLGDWGLREMLGHKPGESPEALCKRVVEEVEKFQQDRRFDDLTLLLIQRRR
jgi:serine phosphatase RsbU (regulator of sigma subunit)